MFISRMLLLMIFHNTGQSQQWQIIQEASGTIALIAESSDQS